MRFLLLRVGFPEKCLRGLRNKEHVSAAGLVTAAAFIPPMDKATLDRREKIGRDRSFESSVNWADNFGEALRLLYDDDQNSAFGVVECSVGHLLTARAHGECGQHLLWERDEIRGQRPNPYHGNILFSEKLDKPRTKELAAVIAAGLPPVMSREQVKKQLPLTTPASSSIGLRHRLGLWLRKIGLT